MPVDDLVAQLIAAARTAFTEARASHPEESFYCYALFTDGLLTYVVPSCGGERGLRLVAGEYVEHSGGTVEGRAGELRWSPADSPVGLENSDPGLDLLVSQRDQVTVRQAESPWCGRCCTT